MKLLIFKADGDGDYGALRFEQSKRTIADVYEEIKKTGNSVTGFDSDSDEDPDHPDWEVSLVKEIEVADRKEANRYCDAINTVMGFCGDYDQQKYVDYHFLLVDDDGNPVPKRRKKS